MKVRILLLVGFLSLLTGCNSKKNKEIASYDYPTEIQLSRKLEEKVGSWIKEGIYCYGIIARGSKETLHAAKPVRAKVLTIKPNAIKMRASETVSIAPVQRCEKMVIEKGDTWWEEDGDLFLTKEEAEAFIAKTIQKQSEVNPNNCVK